MQGNQTFTDSFRVLVAGGGTGNSVSFMGEQLRNTNAEVQMVQGDQYSMIIFPDCIFRLQPSLPGYCQAEGEHQAGGECSVCAREH